MSKNNRHKKRRREQDDVQTVDKNTVIRRDAFIERVGPVIDSLALLGVEQGMPRAREMLMGEAVYALSAEWFVTMLERAEELGASWLAAEIAGTLMTKDFGFNALEAAARTKNVNLCEAILDREKSAGLTLPRQQALHDWMASEGALEIGVALMRNMVGSVHGGTLVRAARRRDHTRLALLLTRADSEGAESAAQESAAKDDPVGLAFCLTATGPGAFKERPTRYAHSALAKSAESGSKACFDLILPFADLASDGPYALLRACGEKQWRAAPEHQGHVEICETIIPFMETPVLLKALQCAAYTGRASCVRAIVRALPSTAFKRSSAREALLDACSHAEVPGVDYSACVQALAACMPDMIEKAKLRAVERGAVGPLTVLLAMSKPISPPPFNKPAFSFFSSQARRASALLKIAVFEAVEGYPDVVARLIEFGADPALKSFGLWGASALSLGARAAKSSKREGAVYEALLANIEMHEIDQAASKVLPSVLKPSERRNRL